MLLWWVRNIGIALYFSCVLRLLFYSLTCVFLRNSRYLWPAGKLCETQGISYREVFKWPSKVIKWLRLVRLVIGLKESRQFFSQWEAKPIAPCTRDFSRASSELQVIARNCDWFIALFVPVVIGRSNCFGFGFSTVIWKPLYWSSICFLYYNTVGLLLFYYYHWLVKRKYLYTYSNALFTKLSNKTTLIILVQ